MDTVRLSARLEAVVGQVARGAGVADIGCDHGLVSARLLLSGIAGKVIAADLRESPLMKAAANFERFDISDMVQLRLGDGLSVVSPDECDTVIIAGMGGDTIADILERAPWVKKGEHTLILQPMSAAERLREWLYKNGIGEAEETLVKEDDGRIYVVMTARGGLEVPRGEEYNYFGLPLKRHFGQLEREYLDRQIFRVARAAQGAASSSKGFDAARAQEFLKLAEGLRRIEKECLQCIK